MVSIGVTRLFYALVVVLRLGRRIGISRPGDPISFRWSRARGSGELSWLPLQRYLEDPAEKNAGVEKLSRRVTSESGV